jgi:hypothetical protein
MKWGGLDVCNSTADGVAGKDYASDGTVAAGAWQDMRMRTKMAAPELGWNGSVVGRNKNLALPQGQE